LQATPADVAAATATATDVAAGMLLLQMLQMGDASRESWPTICRNNYRNYLFVGCELN